MPDKVLYFPYIGVPNSAWFTRVLLYWDEVGTLVPYEFIKAPERLGEHTRSLVEKGLLKQVIPGLHVHRIPKFNDAFLEYLHTLGPGIDSRRSSFDKGKILPIYTEKIFGLDDELVGLKLARRSKQYRNVFDVERQTGLEFMTYLAIGLGRLKDLQFTPITDEQILLEKAISSASPIAEELHRIRVEILEEALPAPSQPLLAREILDFKLDYGEKLRGFRNYIEMELIAISGLPDEELRSRRLELCKEHIKAEIDDIRSKMQSRGWVKVNIGKLCVLLALIPKLKPLAGIAKAAIDAFGSEKPNLDSPLAYAALAQERLLVQ